MVSGGASCSPLHPLSCSEFLSFFFRSASLEPSLLALLLFPLPLSCFSLHSKVDKSERRSRGAAAVFRLRLYSNAHGSGTARRHSFISCRAVAARVSVTLWSRGYSSLSLSSSSLLSFVHCAAPRTDRLRSAACLFSIFKVPSLLLSDATGGAEVRERLLAAGDSRYKSSK